MTINKEAKHGIMVLAIGWFVIGLFVGTIESIDDRFPFDPDKRTDGCTYESLLGFANPGRVIACELWRKRWGK